MTLPFYLLNRRVSFRLRNHKIAVEEAILAEKNKVINVKVIVR